MQHHRNGYVFLINLLILTSCMMPGVGVVYRNDNSDTIFVTSKVNYADTSRVFNYLLPPNDELLIIKDGGVVMEITVYNKERDTLIFVDSTKINSFRDHVEYPEIWLIMDSSVVLGHH